jgi:hypothetical protein
MQKIWSGAWVVTPESDGDDEKVNVKATTSKETYIPRNQV